MNMIEEIHTLWWYYYISFLELLRLIRSTYNYWHVTVRSLISSFSISPRQHSFLDNYWPTLLFFYDIYFLIFSYKLPFDRHDWVVDRDGKEVRYVIDFYTGAKPQLVEGRAPISIYLDVRPALDSYQALADRLSVQYRTFLGKPSLTMERSPPPPVPAPAPVKAATKE